MKLNRYEQKQKDHQLIMLKESIQENLRNCRKANQAKLEHARAIGNDLIRAKALVGTKRGNWTMWLEQSFDLSPPTARVYMRVAKQWNHPDIVMLRNDGMEPKSIRQFLDLIAKEHREVDDLTYDPDSNEFFKEPAILTVARLRDWSKKQFHTWLIHLNQVELEVFEHFANELLGPMERQLRDYVCKSLEYDPYDDTNQLHRDVAERIKKSRQRKRQRNANRSIPDTAGTEFIPPRKAAALKKLELEGQVSG